MKALDFVYQALATRVVFGAGSLQHLEREIDLLGAKRALVLCTPDQRSGAEAVMERLGSHAAGLFDRAVMHVPLSTAREARAMAQSLGADCAVVYGGGSTIGLGKAIALESEIPILAIPTTYSGSEMTPIYGITDEGVKRTGSDQRVMPKTVIYDPDLTVTLPAQLSIASGINAIAHAAEGLYSKDTNPIMSLIAEEGIRALALGLPGIHRDAHDIDARKHALYGSWLCGIVLANGGMALHHKLCHTVGGSFNLPHAQTHTVILPHALAYNADAAPEALARMARAIGTENVPQAIYELARQHGLPTSLQALGMQESELDRAADIASANPYWNPREITRCGLRILLQDAFEGRAPRSAVDFDVAR